MPENHPTDERAAVCAHCGHGKEHHFGMETPHCRLCMKQRRAYLHEFVAATPPTASAPPREEAPSPNNMSYAAEEYRYDQKLTPDMRARLAASPVATTGGEAETAIECPACDSDGEPCAVCKPDSGQWISNDELASLRARLAESEKVRTAAADFLAAWDRMTRLNEVDIALRDALGESLYDAYRRHDYRAALTPPEPT